MLAKRFGAAAAGFVGGGFLTMIALALLVSIFDLGFQSVMPATLIVGSICGVVGFCFSGLGAGLFAMVDW